MGKKCMEKSKAEEGEGGEGRSSDGQRGGRLINDGGGSGRGVKKRAMSSRVRRKER